MSARKPDAELTRVESRLGYQFKDQKLLREALTHASALDGPAKGARSYERLEFLGDRILGLIVAERLYAEHQREGEDGLAPRLNALVNRGACMRAARRAGLGEALLLSTSEASQGGREKDAILSDACESVIAAIYLDGGMDAARAFVAQFWAGEFEGVQETPRDAKTVLQEWAAARKTMLTYVLMEQTGPQHAPRFIVEARISGYPPTRGEGGAKRDAERAAAAAFLAKVGVDV